MKELQIEVELTPEAVREFKEIQDHPRGSVSESGQRALMQLIHFSSRKWAVILRQWRHSAFRSGNHLPFDIRGKVSGGGPGKVRKVLITRFKLKGKVSGGRPGKAAHRELGSALMN